VDLLSPSHLKQANVFHLQRRVSSGHKPERPSVVNRKRSKKKERGDMADQEVVANQKTILSHQASILENQKAILSHQTSILHNQATIEKNQKSLDEILVNQKEILVNQKAILASFKK
jgi:hypothetical protein